MTIDLSTAKFWCIFSDKDFNKKLNDLSKEHQNESISAIALIGYALTGASLVSFFAPYVKNAITKMTSGRDTIIARVKFEANGSAYEAFFDMKPMKWKIVGKLKVSDVEAAQFFSSKFFISFMQRCQSFIEPFLQNKDAVIENLGLIKDSKVKQFLKTFVDNERNIRMNMFNPKNSH